MSSSIHLQSINVKYDYDIINVWVLLMSNDNYDLNK